MAGEAKGGFLGRLFSSKGTDGEPKKKPVKAKLGAKNEFFYDEELKCWREKGKPPPADAGPPPPPPSLGLGSRTGSSGQELGVGALPPSGDGGMQPLRSWSNNSMDGGLPAPTTPTAASSTYVSEGPSAGIGPAAQSPFRARNLRAAPAARYAASSLIPTAPGAGTAAAFASPGKPPLAPAPGGVAMFNPGAAMGGAAAPSFFIPGGGAQPAAPQGPFFGRGPQGGRARGRQPAFENLAEEAGEGERGDTNFLKAVAEEELLSPRDKRAKMDQSFISGSGEESVGDNLGTQAGNIDEAMSPGAGRPPPSFLPPSLGSANFGQSAAATDVGLGGGPNAMTAFPASGDSGGGSDYYASGDATAYNSSYAEVGFEGFGGGETDAEGGFDGGFGINPDPLAADRTSPGFGAFVQGEEQNSGDPLGFGGEAGLAAPELMAEGGDPFSNGGFGGGDGLDVTSYPGSQGLSADPNAGFGSEFVAAGSSSGDVGVVNAKANPAGPYGYGYTEDAGAREAYTGLDAEGGAADAGAAYAGNFGQAAYGAEYALDSNPGGFSGEEGGQAPEVTYGGVAEQTGYGGEFGGEFGAEAGYTGEYGADPNQTVVAEGGGEGGAEVATGTGPYGGLTWEEVLQWVAYYRESGTSTEEEISQWVAGLQQAAVDAGYPAEGGVGTEDATAAAYDYTGEPYNADAPQDGLEGYDATGRGMEGLELGGGDGYQGAGDFTGQDQSVSLVTTVETEVTTTVTQVYHVDSRISAPITGGSRPLAGAFSALTSGRTTAGQSGGGLVGRAGALADWLTANKTASGKITGPLPWELMSNATSAEGDGHSEDSRASSPRPESPREAVFGAVPPIAEGEALITDIAGPREEAFPPLQRPSNRGPQATSMMMQPPPAVRAKQEGSSLGRTGSMNSQVSQGSSMSRNQGTPTSRQSYPAESQAPNYASLPGSPSTRNAPDAGAERWEDVHKGYGTQQHMQPGRHYDQPNGSSHMTLDAGNLGTGSVSATDAGSTAATYGGSVDGSMAAQSEAPGVGSGPGALQPHTWGGGEVGGAGEFEGPAAREGSYLQAEGDTLSAEGGYLQVEGDTHSAEGGYLQGDGDAHSTVPQGVAMGGWGADMSYNGGAPGSGTYAPEGFDTAAEVWGANGTTHDTGEAQLQTTENGAYYAGDQRAYPFSAEGGDWQMSEGADYFAGQPTQDMSYFGERGGGDQTGHTGEGEPYSGMVEGWGPEQVTEAGEEADYFAPDGPPLRALSVGGTGGTGGTDFDAALLAFVSQPLSARHPPSRSVPGTPARPQPLASPFAPRRRSHDAGLASPGVAAGSGTQGFLPMSAGFPTPPLSPPSVTITEIADASVGTPDAGVPLSGEAAERNVGETMDRHAFGSTTDLAAAAPQDEEFAFQVEGGGDGWAGEDLDIDLGLPVEGTADAAMPLNEGPPVRTSGLADAEPSLAGWGSDDQIMLPPKITTKKPSESGEAADMQLREEAASLRPLTIPPSPHAASVPLSAAMTSEDALAELQTRKSAGESELEVALRETRISAERALALEERLEDALRDMRALKEQNDVLRAQAVTFLEGRGDVSPPASPPEDLQDKLEEAFQQMAALREENDALRAQAATLLEEAKDETAAATESEELQEQLERAFQEMAALREENDSLRAQAATLLEESRDAEPPAPNTEELDALRAQLEAERVAVAQLREQLEGASAETSTLAAQKAALAATSAAAEAERGTLAARLAALEEENVAMGDELLAKDEEIENLQGQVMHARKAGGPSADLAARLDQATQQITALQKESAALRGEVQERNASLAKLTSEVEQVRSAGASQAQKEAELTARLEEAAGKLQELEELRSALETHTAEVETHLQEVVEELETSKGAVERLDREVEKLNTSLADKEEALQKAQLDASEAAGKVEAAAQEVAKLGELLQTRDAELASMRTTLEEARAAKQVAERRALKMRSDRDQALKQARVDKTRLETERDEALALAHAEVQRLTAAAAAAPAPALAAIQAELEAERARAAELQREVEQFKEQSELDFQRFAILAKENQQLQEKLEELGGDEGAEGIADALNDALTERDRLALRCADLEAAAAASHALPAADPAELAGLRAELAAANAELAALRASHAVDPAELANARAELETTKSTLISVQDATYTALQKKDTELATLHSEVDAAMVREKNMNDALEKMLKEKLAVHAELTSAMLGADEKEAELRARLDDAQAALAAARKEAESEGAALKNALDAAENELKSLRKEREDAAAGVEAEREALRQDLAAAQTQIAILKAEIADARHGADASVASLLENLDAAETRARELELAGESAASDARAEVETLKETLETARATARQQDAELAVVQNALAARDADLAAVQAELAAARTGNAGEAAASGEKLETLKQRLAEAEAEAADLFARQTQLEEEAAVVEGEAARAAAARDAALARAAQAEARLAEALQQPATNVEVPAVGLASGGAAASDLESRVAELEAALEAQARDHADLLACLGQESAKVDALVSALEEQGVDTEQLLEKVEEEYGYGDEAPPSDADDDEGGEGQNDVDLTKHVSGGHVGGTSALSHAELDLAPPSPTGGASGKPGHNADPPLETGEHRVGEAAAPACISVKLGAADEEVGGTPDAEKVASSGTTSDGSWREVHLRSADNDWAEVPIQGSRPESPDAQPPAHPGGQQGANGVGSGEVGRGPIPFGQQPAKSLADAFGRGSATAPQTLTGPPEEPNLELDGWGDDWASIDA